MRALVVLLLLLLFGTASAETKSWTAVKAKIPAGTIGVVGFDLKALRKTKGFDLLLKSIFAEGQGAKNVHELIKDACSLDVVTVLSDVTVLAGGKDELVAVIGLDGIDEAKGFSCLTKVVATLAPKAKVSSSKAGALTAYTIDQDTIYAAWLAKDVIAVSSSKQRDHLDAMIAGKPPAGDLAAHLGKVDVNAFGWGAGLAKENDFSGLYGTGKLANKALVLDVKFAAKTPASAKKMQAEAVKELTAEARTAKPEAARILKAIKLDTAGSTLALTATFPEADWGGLLAAFDKLF